MRIGELLASFSSRRDGRQPPPEAPSAPAEDTATGLDQFAVPSSCLVSLDPTRPVVFTGFDDKKLNEPLKLETDGLPKSAKYTFAKLALASCSMPETKLQAEDWFNTFIRPGMESAGFRIGWVREDQALISTRDCPRGELITFLRGAGSGIPGYIALSWKSQRAEDAEVTMLEDPLSMIDADPVMKAQRELALYRARKKHSSLASMQRELRDRIRVERFSAQW